MFTVITPAPDRALLTLAELRGAVGIADTSADGVLQTIGDRVAATIARHCLIAGDGVYPVTLRRETVEESFRLDHPVSRLVLARRPVAAVEAVTERGAALTSAEYEILGGSGVLVRLIGDTAAGWPVGRISVVYEAGYATPPDDLKMAAAKLVRIYWNEKSRDPLIRQETIPDVLSTTYWVGSLGDGALPPDIADLLSPYINRRL